MNEQITKQEIELYLTGGLSEAAQERVETAYFDDDQLFARIQRVEEELIESYAADAMRPAQRLRFETHYLTTPEKRLRVAVVRRLLKTDPVMPPIVAVSWAQRWREQFARWGLALSPRLAYGALALVTLAVFGGGLWLWYARRSAPEQAQVRPVVTPTPAVSRPEVAPEITPDALPATPTPNGVNRPAATPPRVDKPAPARSPAAPGPTPERNVSPVSSAPTTVTINVPRLPQAPKTVPSSGGPPIAERVVRLRPGTNTVIFSLPDDDAYQIVSEDLPNLRVTAQPKRLTTVFPTPLERGRSYQIRLADAAGRLLYVYSLEVK